MSYMLMTGATGLLGSQLLTQLLQRRSRLAVLVRSAAGRSGRERIEAIVGREEEIAAQRLPRPIVLEGDITAPFFGLSAGDCDWLRRSCTSVLHNAAALEFHGADKAGEPWRTNVGGTTNLISLAERAGITEFHHVSTAYVCGLAPGPIPEAPSNGDCGFRNDYERSKHEAEWLVRSARLLSQPTFYRPAVIVGHSRTGATTTYHGLMAMLRLMSVISRSLPADDRGFRKVPVRLAMSGHERLNMVPVDWVAEAIARLVVMPAARGRTIHLAPKRPTTMLEIVDAASSYLNAEKMRFCGPERPQDLNEVESMVYSGKAIYEGYEQTDHVFETTALDELLPDLPCPVIDETMVHRFLAFGDADRWGKRRRSSAKIRPEASAR
jgi:thioester reductase-like protein